MRFDTRTRRRAPSGPGYGGPGVRIVLLLVMLLLTFAAMRTARRPKTWGWMFAGRETAASKPAMPENPGEIVIDLSPVAKTAGGDAALGESRADAQVAQHLADESPLAEDLVPPTRVPGVELDASRLGMVRDNTRLRQRPQEGEAYYYALDRARQADAQTLDARARRDVTFPQFLTDPQKYRGALVSLEGTAHRVITYPAGANDYGLEKLYEAWVFTSDSQNHPLIVVCTRVPEGFPLGDRLGERVRVTGYFFKNNAYSAGDADRIAPMILAQRLVWLRTATAPPVSPVTRMLLAGLGIVVFWVVPFALLGRWVATQKGRSATEGTVLGGVLGIVGVAVEACLSRGLVTPAGGRSPMHAHDVAEVTALLDQLSELPANSETIGILSPQDGKPKPGEEFKA